MSITYNIKMTAYAAAVEGGYTGTYEEFCEQQATYAENVALVTEKAEQVATDAATVALDKDDVETLAGQVATNAAAVAANTETTTAAASAANTSASSAAASSDNAGRSAAAAAESATASATSASVSAGYASNAESSASEASESATEAGTSETNAAASAAAAAASLGDVTAAKAEALAAIQTKGEETLESIPEDYTTLSNDVSSLKSDLENLDPGLSDEAKAALLACFEHVAWADDDGQNYYDALHDALYDDSAISITAVYDSSHTAYPWNTLDSLKPYLTVILGYQDGTSQVISDYTLSGALDSASSAITVAASGLSTIISVPVTIDPALLFYVQSGYISDGTDATAIVTGIKLSETNTTCSIIFDVVDSEIVTSVKQANIVGNFHMLTNTSVGYGAYMASVASGNDYIKQYVVLGEGGPSESKTNLSNTSHNVKGAVTHVKNTNIYKLTLYVDGVQVALNTSKTGTHTNDDAPIAIGKRYNGGYRFKGTINLCNIYSKELNLNEIKSLLGVS